MADPTFQDVKKELLSRVSESGGVVLSKHELDGLFSIVDTYLRIAYGTSDTVTSLHKILVGAAEQAGFMVPRLGALLDLAPTKDPIEVALTRAEAVVLHSALTALVKYQTMLASNDGAGVDSLLQLASDIQDLHDGEDKA